MRYSVLIPVYNVEQYIKQCIDSIILQQKEIEIILVNDGSNDNSLSICKEYERNYSFIKVVNKENEGLLAARRDALKICRGEYVLFLDSDDYFINNLLEEIENCIRNNKPDIILFNYCKKHKNYVEFIKILKNSNEGIVDKNEIIKNFVMGNINNLWIKCVKRECIDIKNDYYGYCISGCAEDVLQTMPILDMANRIFYLDKYLYMYRMNNNSITHSRKIIHVYISDMGKVYDTMLEYLDKWEVNDDLFIEFYNCYAELLCDQLIELFVFNYNKCDDMTNLIYNYKCNVNILNNIKKLKRLKTRLILIFFKKRKYRLLKMILKSFLFVKKVIKK